MSSDLGMEQERRTARALAEMADWAWTKGPRGWVVTTRNGTYEVLKASCSCPDHKHNCAGLVVRCKHRVALGIREIEQQTRPAPLCDDCGDPAPRGVCPDCEEVGAAVDLAQRLADDAAFDRIFG